MDFNLDDLRMENGHSLYRNLGVPKLIEHAVKRAEGVLADHGALVVNTGKYTGRSPSDRFIIRDHLTKETINWGEVNKPLDEQIFDKIYHDVLAYLKQKGIVHF